MTSAGESITNLANCSEGYLPALLKNVYLCSSHLILSDFFCYFEIFVLHVGADRL